MGKQQKTQQTPPIRAKRSAPSRQATTRQQRTDPKARETQDTNDPQKKHRPRTVSENIPLEGLNQSQGANFALNSDVDQSK